MKTINTVAIIGMGAIGGAFYDHLARNLPDADVFAVAGGQRAKKLGRQGIYVNGKRHSVRVHESYKPGHADLLVFAVKDGALAQSIEEARGLVGENTVVLSFLNGILSEQKIAAAYGPKTLYSYCVGTDSTRVGEEIVCRTMFTVPFGDAVNVPGQYSENVLAVQDFFERARIKYEIPEDMIRSLWYKYMINMGVNQTLAVVRQPYAALQREGYARDIARDTMLETVAVALCEGVRLNETDVDRAFEVVNAISPQGKPSTLQDVEAGRETEIEMFSGDLLRMAERHGLDLPVNKMLYRLVKAAFIPPPQSFDPVHDGNSRVLILGTFPSPKSRESGFYYGHPQNAFWRTLAAALNVPEPESDAASRRAFLLRNNVALWDVLHTCDIDGANDATIRNGTPNDIRSLLENSRIRAVFTNGRKAHELYDRYCLKQTGVPAVYLPSTSPANVSRVSKPEFTQAWRAVGNALREG